MKKLIWFTLLLPAITLAQMPDGWQRQITRLDAEQTVQNEDILSHDSRITALETAEPVSVQSLRVVGDTNSEPNIFLGVVIGVDYTANRVDAFGPGQGTQGNFFIGIQGDGPYSNTSKDPDDNIYFGEFDGLYELPDCQGNPRLRKVAAFGLRPIERAPSAHTITGSLIGRLVFNANGQVITALSRALEGGICENIPPENVTVELDSFTQVIIDREDQNSLTFLRNARIVF